MSKVKPEPNSSSGTNGYVLEFLALCGLALEWKHGLPSLCEPFLGCRTLAAFLATLGNLSDATFLGLFVWVAILFGTIAIICGLIVAYARRTLRWFREPRCG